jgi:RimJ/RimL family protein N-acetyltransferase
VPAEPAAPGDLQGLLPAAVYDKENRVSAVRSYQPGDRELLERFYAEFTPKREAQGLPPEGAPRVARWLDSILSAGTHLLVEHEGRLVGHAMIIPTDRPGVSEYAIFLEEAVRGQGLGTEVNILTAQVARTMRIDRLWLSVEPRNRPAVRSYEKAGFRFKPETVFTPELEMELVL